MAKRITSIGNGKAYLLNDDGSVKCCLGEVTFPIMPHEEYLRLQAVCHYKGAHCARDNHTLLEEHCNHTKNRADGCSWGECEWHKCPLNWEADHGTA